IALGCRNSSTLALSNYGFLIKARTRVASCLERTSTLCSAVYAGTDRPAIIVRGEPVVESLWSRNVPSSPTANLGAPTQATTEDPPRRIERRLDSRLQRARPRGFNGNGIARRQGDRGRFLEHLVDPHHDRPVRRGDLGDRDGADLRDGSDKDDVGLFHECRPAHLGDRGSGKRKRDGEEHR